MRPVGPTRRRPAGFITRLLALTLTSIFAFTQLIRVVSDWGHYEYVLAQIEKGECSPAPSSKCAIPSFSVEQHFRMMGFYIVEVFLRKRARRNYRMTIFDLRSDRHFNGKWPLQLGQLKILAHWIFSEADLHLVSQSIGRSPAKVFQNDDRSRLVSNSNTGTIFTLCKNVSPLCRSRNNERTTQNPRLNEADCNEETGEPTQRCISWRDYRDGGGCLVCGLGFLALGCSFCLDRGRAFCGWLALACALAFFSLGIFTMQYG